MKEFFIKNWTTITLSILGVIFVYLLVRVFTPTPDMSELNKYKLEEIDKRCDGFDGAIRQIKVDLARLIGEIESIKSIEAPSTSGEIDRTLFYIIISKCDTKNLERITNYQG